MSLWDMKSFPQSLTNVSTIFRARLKHAQQLLIRCTHLKLARHTVGCGHQNLTHDLLMVPAMVRGGPIASMAARQGCEQAAGSWVL